MTLLLAASFVLPLLLSVVLTVAVRRWSLRQGFVDEPAGHKAHAEPTPLGGGIAIFLTLILAGGATAAAADLLLVLGPPEWVPPLVRTHLAGIAAKRSALFAVLGGAAVLHFVGIIDDKRPLGAWPKLIAQLAVALLLTVVFRIRALEMFGPVVAVLASVVWIVVITNAFNFLDNMDGLSAGVAVITLVIFAVAARMTGQIFVPALALVVGGAVGGFLIFNFPPARIFMGDGGSTVVGYMIAVLTILTTFHDPSQSHRPFGVLVPLVVLAVPLYDFASVVIIRARAGDSIFRADRRHFSHRIQSRGLSRRASVLTIYLATAATGLPAMFLPNSAWPTALVVVGQCLCVVALIAVLEQGKGAPEASAES